MSSSALTDIHKALRTRLLTWSDLPAAALRAWDNLKFDPPALPTPYVEESFVPGGADLIGTARGRRHDTGLYIVTWHGAEGTDVAPLTQPIDRLLAVFPAALSLNTAAGDVVKIRGLPAPSRSQVLPSGGGRALCRAVIPWECWTNNF